MWGGAIRFTAAMMFAIAFLIEFTMGGLSGVIFAVAPIDWQLTDTYFLVAHIHYVLFGGTYVRYFRRRLLLVPKIHRPHAVGAAWHMAFLAYHRRLPRNVFVQHVLGAWGMPRRVWTYPRTFRSGMF